MYVYKYNMCICMCIYNRTYAFVYIYVHMYVCVYVYINKGGLCIYSCELGCMVQLMHGSRRAQCMLRRHTMCQGWLSSECESVCLQESALCAQNATSVERLTVEGQAQYKPLALASTYAADKKTQVRHLLTFSPTGHALVLSHSFIHTLSGAAGSPDESSH